MTVSPTFTLLEMNMTHIVFQKSKILPAEQNNITTEVPIDNSESVINVSNITTNVPITVEPVESDEVTLVPPTERINLTEVPRYVINETTLSEEIRISCDLKVCNR